MHDDGDEEDLEEDEVVQGRSLYAEHPAARRFEEKAAKAREAEAAATSVELEGWRLEGHALVQRRVARSFDEGGHTLGCVRKGDLVVPPENSVEKFEWTPGVSEESTAPLEGSEEDLDAARGALEKMLGLEKEEDSSDGDKQ